MKFAIGTVENFEEHGFNTTKFRKSIDGTKAIIHLAYAEILCHATEMIDEITVTNYEIYTSPSIELLELLASEEWSIQEEV